MRVNYSNCFSTILNDILLISAMILEGLILQFFREKLKKWRYWGWWGQGDSRPCRWVPGGGIQLLVIAQTNTYNTHWQTVGSFLIFLIFILFFKFLSLSFFFCCMPLLWSSSCWHQSMNDPMYWDMAHHFHQSRPFILAGHPIFFMAAALLCNRDLDR